MTGEQGVRLDRRLAWLILVTFALGLVAALITYTPSP